MVCSSVNFIFTMTRLPNGVLGCMWRWFADLTCCSCRLQLKRDGTRWRMGGKVKGKLANGVSSQYSLHYLGTWCNQHYYHWCAHLGCQYSTELTPPADLNGLVRFAENEIWYLRVCHHISNAVYNFFCIFILIYLFCLLSIMIMIMCHLVHNYIFVQHVVRVVFKFYTMQSVKYTTYICGKMCVLRNLLTVFVLYNLLIVFVLYNLLSSFCIIYRLSSFCVIYCLSSFCIIYWLSSFCIIYWLSSFCIIYWLSSFCIIR